MSALLEAAGLTKEFPARAGLFAAGGLRGEPARRLRVLDRVDLAVARGECLALVGESGSGKTTLGRCMIRLVEPTAGSLRFDGEDLLALPPRELRRRRRRFQMVFQDPYGSLDPRIPVGWTVAEPLAVHTALDRRRRRAAAVELLQQVGLGEEIGGRYPHELSGGQRQRVGIARALASGPDLLIADEPLSALDASIQAQVLSLLADLRESHGLTLLLISHDLAVVERVAERVAVLYLGRVVELAPAAELFAGPRHPYTVSLLSAVPRLPVPGEPRRRARIVLQGEPPSPAAPPSGCAFHPRCPIARPRCAVEEPPLAAVAPGRAAACFYPGELAAAGPSMEQSGCPIVH